MAADGDWPIIERDEDFTTINQSASFFNIGIGIEFLPRKHFLYMRLQVADWVYPIFHSPELWPRKVWATLGWQRYWKLVYKARVEVHEQRSVSEFLRHPRYRPTRCSRSFAPSNSRKSCGREKRDSSASLSLHFLGDLQCADAQPSRNPPDGQG